MNSSPAHLLYKWIQNNKPCCPWMYSFPLTLTGPLSELDPLLFMMWAGWSCTLELRSPRVGQMKWKWLILSQNMNRISNCRYYRTCDFFRNQLYNSYQIFLYVILVDLFHSCSSSLIIIVYKCLVPLILLFLFNCTKWLASLWHPLLLGIDCWFT